jgi:tRNA pseudouridine32 synthase/23S rRNA pseudouridine746 synthase
VPRSDQLPPAPILHDDEDVIAVAKPSGEPVIAARGEPPGDCLQKRLERQLGCRLFVVHRIDRDASGVVLFARNADAHRRLSLAFEHREVAKAYAAFVAGAVHPPRGQFDTALHPARRGKTRPARPGEPAAQPAVTDYVVLEHWRLEAAAVSLLQLHPVTGRHHQIRVHLRSAGTPILFDPLYARGLVPPLLARAPCARLALHASRIEIPRPRGAGRLVVEAELAPDLVALERWLDASGRRDLTASGTQP